MINEVRSIFVRWHKTEKEMEYLSTRILGVGKGRYVVFKGCIAQSFTLALFFLNIQQLLNYGKSYKSAKGLMIAK